MKKLIVLVQPYTHGRTTVRPLGLGYLASSLLKSGYSVKIIDNDLHKLKNQDLAKEIIAMIPDAVGITTNVLNKWNAVGLATAISSHIRYIVFGGPEATLFPDWFLKKENFFVLRGECERSFLSFLKYIKGGIPIEEVKNLSFLERYNHVIHNESGELEEDLDNIPFPNTELFEMDKYKFKSDRHYYTNIISSRGCPFRCIFCYHRLNGKFRQRSPENIIDEINMLKSKYGYKAFIFWDDNFTLRKKFVFSFCERLLKRNIKIYWHCLSSSRNIDMNMLKLMRKAGCRLIYFGMESGSPNSLKRMGKSCTVEDNIKAVDSCRKIGIKSKAFITIGYPWETYNDIFSTVGFLKKHPPDYIQALIVFPFPNTDLEKTILSRGYTIDYNAIKGVRDLNVPSYETGNFKKEDLIKWRNLIVDTHTKALYNSSLKLRIKKDLKRIFNEAQAIFKKR